jgi:hypothetical protein
MKRTAGFLLSTICLCLVAGAAVYGWQWKARADSTFHLANGVAVTPVTVQEDELSGLTAAALGVKVWKFDIALPPSHAFSYSLTRCEKGRPVETLSSVSVEQPKNPGRRHETVTVALLPEGTGFDDADKLKCYVAYRSWNSAGAFPNPLKGYQIMMENLQSSNTYNLIYLLSTSKKKAISGMASENDVSIALSVHEQP